MFQASISVFSYSNSTKVIISVNSSNAMYTVQMPCLRLRCYVFSSAAMYTYNYHCISCFFSRVYYLPMIVSPHKEFTGHLVISHLLTTSAFHQISKRTVPTLKLYSSTRQLNHW